MHNIKWIRKEPKLFDEAMERRGLGALSNKILELDKEKRGGQTNLQELQERSNAVAKSIGALMAEGKKDKAQAAIEEGKQLKEQIAALKDAEDIDGEQDAVMEFLSTLPNILDDDVPDGGDESANKEVRKWGEPRNLDFSPKEHFEIGRTLGQMDFEQTAKISGSRFATLTGQLAHLERALANFMLDIHTQKFDYTEVSPPLLVRPEAMYGTSQLPKFAEDAFKTTDGKWLISTSEIALANLVREQILDEAELPLRFVAHTPCFRSEAGSAGKDTHGLIRQHQFYKVELVSIVTPEHSEEELERKVNCAEEILKQLELPYRVMLLCAGDTGFGSAKTYDLEVWLPGQDNYREISSCSNCRDFQSRRMKARCRPKGERDTRFVHTLNGSGLAVGRTLLAIIENFQNENGSVTLPSALQPYMGGLTEINVTK